MNDKIIFTIILALLLVFLIIRTFIDCYKLTHPRITKIDAKVLCRKIDKRSIVEYIDHKDIVNTICEYTQKNAL